MRDETDEALESGELITPFRGHLDHCEGLDGRQQLEECADYIQHIELLVSEFMESYYLVERLWQPDKALSGPGNDDSQAEMILEPFYESMTIRVANGFDDEGEDLVCVSGAMSPLPDGEHPALSRRGLDFVGLRNGEVGHIVLGVAQSSKDETPFMLLLRALNALAELSPPFRIMQLGNEIVRSSIPENADFSLNLCVSEPDPSPDGIALGQLTRDLAEAFGQAIAGIDQVSGMLGEIACLDIDSDSLADGHLKRHWRVSPRG